MVSSLSDSILSGTTCALVAISVPSPTTNPVPRKENCGLRVQLVSADGNDRRLDAGDLFGQGRLRCSGSDEAHDDDQNRKRDQRERALTDRIMVGLRRYDIRG